MSIRGIAETVDPWGLTVADPSGAVAPPTPSPGTATPDEGTPPAPVSWRAFALCAGLDTALFFPAIDDPGSSSETAIAARAVCAACPVVDACLDENLYEKYGVFGGTTDRERRTLRRARARNQETP